MVVGVCRLRLHLPGCGSLKEKRGRLKPLLARLRREYNLSAAEVDLHDVWQSAEIGLAVVSTEAGHAQSELEAIVRWVDRNWPDVDVEAQALEVR